MSFLVVANFKSNLTKEQVESWLKVIKPTPNMVIAPSFLHLSTIHDLKSTISLAAQDVSPFPPGSYTGAVNASQLKELGVTYCIVGHSERRRYFHETPSDIASKIRELVSVGITPILCMDELDVIPQFAALDTELYAQCIYCFEPSGGIGGTATASLETIKKVQDQVRQFIEDGRFMYGGSVNQDNVVSLLPLNLFGVLVASASLDPVHFQSIVTKATHAS